MRQHVGLGNDSQHAHHRGGVARAREAVACANRQVDAIKRRAAIGGIERRSHIGGRREPRRHLRRQFVHRCGIAHGRVCRTRQQVIALGVGAVPHDRAARKTCQLRGHGVNDLMLIGAPLQHAVGLEHHMRAAVAGGSLCQGAAQGQRNRARHKRDHEHDEEHAGIAAVDKRQRVARVDKQEVVERHGGSRAQQAIQATPGKECAQLNGEHIDDHDARRETRMVEQRAHNRRRDQQPHRYAGVIQRSAARQRCAPPPKAIGNIAVRTDVHQRPAPLSKQKPPQRGQAPLWWFPLWWFQVYSLCNRRSLDKQHVREQGTHAHRSKYQCHDRNYAIGHIHVGTVRKEPIFGGVGACLTYQLGNHLAAIKHLCIHVCLPGLNLVHRKPTPCNPSAPTAARWGPGAASCSRP